MCVFAWKRERERATSLLYGRREDFNIFFPSFVIKKTRIDEKNISCVYDFFVHGSSANGFSSYLITLVFNYLNSNEYDFFLGGGGGCGKGKNIFPNER